MKSPGHIGIILDGNRRWALKKGLPSFEGHIKGLEAVKKTVKHAQKRGVEILSLFVFSTENWKRSKEEVDFLMSLIEKLFRDEYQKKDLFDKIKVRVVGERDRISKKIKEIIEQVEEETKNNSDMVLNIALSYGGRAEIIEAIRKIVDKKISPEEIDERVMRDNLSVPDLDLIIRTGYEQRLSNFFIWQAAYSELCFPNKYWPDFNEKDLDEAIDEYNQRQRRFGK
ncbi:MAG: polyprenyl diphosphate synthase [Minisyncoccales bacterium]|jgi:undecaprenyl diphosphate synthase